MKRNSIAVSVTLISYSLATNSTNSINFRQLGILCSYLCGDISCFSYWSNVERGPEAKVITFA